jgi:hypothetical protein
MNLVVHPDADEMSNISAGVNEGNPSEIVYWIFLQLPAIHRFCPLEHHSAQQQEIHHTEPRLQKNCQLCAPLRFGRTSYGGDRNQQRIIVETVEDQYTCVFDFTSPRITTPLFEYSFSISPGAAL